MTARWRTLHLAVALIVTLGSPALPSSRGLAADLAEVSLVTIHDPRDAGPLDVRRLSLQRTPESLRVTARFRAAWLPRILGPRGTGRLAFTLDIDGDGHADYRVRAVAEGRWLGARLRALAPADTLPGRRRVHGDTLLLFRPDRRSLTLEVPLTPALPSHDGIRVSVRTRFRSADRACRPCSDRAPNLGRLSAPAGIAYQLHPLGPTAVPLGATVRYRLVATNPTNTPAVVTVPLRLSREGGGAVLMRRHRLSIPAHSSVSVEDGAPTGQWFSHPGSFAVDSPTVPLAPLMVDVAPPVATVPRFIDVTDEAGLAVPHATITTCGAYAAGAAWGDVDGDGRPDLYLPRQGAPGILWLQQPDATFSVSDAGVANPERKGMGAVFGDYDDDGDQDLYVVNDGANRLYANDGAGAFSDVTTTAGVGDTGPGSSASWGDYDGDGDLDLYVTNYFRCTGSVAQPFDDVLYENAGDGTFTDVTDILRAEGPTHGFGFQAAWIDYDDDGDVDLYLANDHIGHPVANVLWRNDGAGGPHGWRFTNVSLPSGSGAAMNAMGIGVGDPDGDLDLDLAVSNMGAAKLFLNDGSGVFLDRARWAGVARETQGEDAMTVTWGTAFADLNNDTHEDLYVAAGSLSRASPEDQPNAVYANAGDGTFYDLSAMSGADDPGISRGVALADYDRDGRMDIYVVNQWGAPRLYRNVTQGAGNSLEVDLEGSVSNRDGCGARVIAHLSGGRSLLREMHCGSVGLASGSDTVVHFGLGEADHAEELEIRWPSGSTQTLMHGAPDLAGFVTVTEA